MTECERIIGKGILDEIFLKEEFRDGFWVDRNRKILWMVLLDIVIEFDKICKKHNLKYFLDSGSLLGAIRHKGFIPWDDDIDIAMPRNDYEKLLLLKDEFSLPYMLQTPFTDSDYAYSFAKIRNVNTTFASEAFIYNKYNQGCFIDIFPYDQYDINKSEILYSQMRTLTAALSVSMKRTNPYYRCSDILSLSLLEKYSTKEIYTMIQNVAKNAKNDSKEYITSLVLPMTHFKKKAYKTVWFEDTINTSFENIMLPIPYYSHEVLSTIFGDYMQLPSDEDKAKCHIGAICKPDIPYYIFQKEYITKSLK